MDALRKGSGTAQVKDPALALSVCSRFGACPGFPLKNKEVVIVYWDINKPLSYDRLFNFIIGNRGGGKTYGALKWCVNRWTKTGEQFIYLRRYETEVKAVKPSLFQALNHEFDNRLITGKTNTLAYVGTEENTYPMGYIFALSKMSNIKSFNMEDVSTIIFDEFLIDKGATHYIREEAQVFLNFYETVARMRNVRVLFLANSVSIINPYFSYFRLKIPEEGIWANGDVLVEMVRNEEYVNEKRKTRFGRLIENTNFAEYSIENKFVLDRDSFVCKRSGKSYPYLGFRAQGNSYVMWRCPDMGCYYFQRGEIPAKTRILALTVEDHDEKTELIDKSTTYCLDLIVMFFRRGLMRFDSIQSKNVFQEILYRKAS